MKIRIPHKQPSGTNSHDARRAKTGEHCPMNGWWASTGRENDRRFIAEGSLMPANNGQPITWTVVAGGSDLLKPKYDQPAAGASIDNH